MEKKSRLHEKSSEFLAQSPFLKQALLISVANASLKLIKDTKKTSEAYQLNPPLPLHYPYIFKPFTKVYQKTFPVNLISSPFLIAISKSNFSLKLFFLMFSSPRTNKWEKV
jgi:hypothetical protein